MTSRTLKVAPRETPKSRQVVRPVDPVEAWRLEVKDLLEVISDRLAFVIKMQAEHGEAIKALKAAK